MQGSYLGEFSQMKLKELIIGAKYNKFSYEELIDTTSEYLSRGKAMVGFKEGWNLDLEL